MLFVPHGRVIVEFVASMLFVFKHCLPFSVTKVVFRCASELPGVSMHCPSCAKYSSWRQSEEMVRELRNGQLMASERYACIDRAPDAHLFWGSLRNSPGFHRRTPDL